MRALSAVAFGAIGALLVASCGGEDQGRVKPEKPSELEPIDDCAEAEGYEFKTIVDFELVHNRGSACSEGLASHAAHCPDDSFPCSFYFNKDDHTVTSPGTPPAGIDAKECASLEAAETNHDQNSVDGESIPDGPRCGTSEGALRVIAKNIGQCYGKDGRLGWGTGLDIKFQSRIEAGLCSRTCNRLGFGEQAPEAPEDCADDDVRIGCIASDVWNECADADDRGSCEPRASECPTTEPGPTATCANLEGTVCHYTSDTLRRCSCEGEEVPAWRCADSCVTARCKERCGGASDHPVDMSAWDGISLWVRRGDPSAGSAVILSVIDIENENVDASSEPHCGCTEESDGGFRCWKDPSKEDAPLPDTQKCDPFGIPLPLTDEWTFLAIPFSDLRQKGFGFASATGRLDASQISRLQLLTTSGDWDYWIDDVALFRERR